MPTNQIGYGTRNMPINVPVDERAFWGRLATDLNAKSIGQLHRLLLMIGLEQCDPAKAAELKAIRQRYYGSTLLVLIIGALIFQTSDNLNRRTNSRSTVRQTIKIRSGRRGLDDTDVDDLTGVLIVPDMETA